jgi:signal transduction histidine kinase
MPKQVFVGTDWLISHIRWVLLVALCLISALDPSQRSRLLPIFAVLLAGGIYNLIVVLLLRRKHPLRWLGEVTVAIDALLVTVVAYVSAQPSYFLFALFPIIVAAIKFGVEISLLVASMVSAAYGGFVYFVQPWLVGDQVLPATMVHFLTLFLGAIATSLLGPRVMRAKLGDAEQQAPPSAAYRERFRAIYEMTGELISSLNYQLILDQILEAGLPEQKENEQRSLQKPVSMVLFFNEERGCLYVEASRNLSKADELRQIDGTTGLIAHVLASGEPTTSNRPNADRDLSSFQAIRRCRTVLCVPLRAGLDLYGVALFASPEPDAYGDAYMELITAFCNQASIALQNAELYHNLQEERKRILFSDEELRKQLARELHDGPTQSISSIAMRLDFIRTLLESDPARAKEELNKLERLAGQAVKEVRTMLFSMRPMILETQGLAAALQHYAERIQQTDNIEVQVNAEGLEKRPVPLVEGATFFIVEEAINNAKKHADPQHVWVDLESRNGELFAQVKDDGKGFDVAEVESSYESRSSLGLVNMRERARLINGRLTIESQPLQGTTVTLTAPMSGQEEPQ